MSHINLQILEISLLLILISNANCRRAEFESAESTECPENFTRVGQKCYNWYKELSWDIGSEVCHYLNATYAVIENEDDLKNIKIYMNQNEDIKFGGAWLGLIGLSDNGTIIWEGSNKPVKSGLVIQRESKDHQQGYEHKPVAVRLIHNELKLQFYRQSVIFPILCEAALKT